MDEPIIRKRGRPPKQRLVLDSAPVESPLPVETAVPTSIKMLESTTIAWGSGLLTFKAGSIVTDPWLVNAALSCGVKYESVGFDVRDTQPTPVFVPQPITPRLDANAHSMSGVVTVPHL